MESVTICENLGGVLGHVNNIEETTYLLKQLEKTEESFFLEGKIKEYFPWFIEEDNMLDEEFCIEVNKEVLNVISCDLERKSLCEFSCKESLNLIQAANTVTPTTTERTQQRIYINR